MQNSTNISSTFSEYCTGYYGFAFNGKENDDEIKGTGNSLDFGARIYDGRIGRRWNVDPVIKESESPYLCFSGNPIYYVDPSGSDAVETVDKKNKTVTVKMNFYYNKSDKNMASQAITADKTISSGPMAGETSNAEISKVGSKGWSSQSWSVTDDDGGKWTVNYEINFIPLETAEAVDNKLKEEKTANRLVYEDDLQSAGAWRPDTRTLAIGTNRRMDGDGTTTIHEIGHAASLPHAYEMPDSQYNGWNCPGSKDHNAGSQEQGEMMSYAKNRSIQNYEVKMSVIKAINLAKKVKTNIVKIHVKGSSKANPVIIK